MLLQKYDFIWANLHIRRRFLAGKSYNDLFFI